MESYSLTSSLRYVPLLLHQVCILTITLDMYLYFYIWYVPLLLHHVCTFTITSGLHLYYYFRYVPVLLHQGFTFTITLFFIANLYVKKLPQMCTCSPILFLIAHVCHRYEPILSYCSYLYMFAIGMYPYFHIVLNCTCVPQVCLYTCILFLTANCHKYIPILPYCS